MRHAWLALLLLAAACSGSPAATPDAYTGKDAECADTFGDVLTDSFGRVDGTVVAVVEPGNPRCAQPNRDHVVVQVELDGAVYRMVVNVQSDGADPDIRVRTLDAALPAPAFGEGWHPGLGLDYATDLGVHSTDTWEALGLQDASAWVSDAITVGDPIAVYATSSGGTYAGSAHLVHRQDAGGTDGAIVLDPTSASPRWLLFHFATQTF